MYSVFSNFYSQILSHGLVPESFTLGFIIPVLKKPTLNPNISGNYRPITLSTTHAKLIKLLMLPKDDNCSSQFGFRDNRGTTFAAALFNDVTSYFRHGGSPVYTCSLDAEKCFDSIWHSALLYKLRDKIPTNQWLIMYRLYSRLKASVRMNG